MVETCQVGGVAVIAGVRMRGSQKKQNKAILSLKMIWD